ncbi:hypothetical protein [Paenibacillus sp. IHBB 10380]|uniref:hypothetical protein n=1 Tax=Paenibacillus sp. IHBB 10380 TaxID=1566358 RepID=UPI0005CFD22D|nr:hypothetical protein [Paenibacillus sp. IHBB 10380]AJS58308.1 hypothetical protein UB51_07125 [Paenibacillus sp. IHBB 10380]
MKAFDPNYISDNIRAGTSIFGVPGKHTVVDTVDAVLNPQFLLVGSSGYDDGVLKQGTMPDRSTENHHMPAITTNVFLGDRVFLQPPHGFYNGGTWVATPAPAFTPGNIKKGVDILGIVGTMPTIGSLQMNFTKVYEIPAGGQAIRENLYIIPPCSSFINFECSTIWKETSIQNTGNGGSGRLQLVDANGVEWELFEGWRGEKRSFLSSYISIPTREFFHSSVSATYVTSQNRGMPSIFDFTKPMRGGSNLCMMNFTLSIMLLAATSVAFTQSGSMIKNVAQGSLRRGERVMTAVDRLRKHLPDYYDEIVEMDNAVRN